MACCLEPTLLGENSACMPLSSATKPAAAAARASCSSMLMKTSAVVAEHSPSIRHKVWLFAVAADLLLPFDDI